MSQGSTRRVIVIAEPRPSVAVAAALPIPVITIVIRQLEAIGLELLGLVGLISRTAMGGRR